ncbi:MAG: divalent-cation tolerance protein CutA [Sphingomonadales bacterium]
MSGYISVYMTASSAEEAEAIAKTLVAERLAACVNILGGIRSVYRWNGAVQNDAEVALVAKTRAALFDALSARVKTLHSYEVPCIVAWPIAAGDAGYLAWIGQETGREG